MKNKLVGSCWWILVGIANMFVGSTVLAAIVLNTPGSAYMQDFNMLANTGTSSALPPGWVFSEGGTNANSVYTAGNGSSNAGDTYSFGATGSTDRALGGLQSGTLLPTIGAEFSNDTGATITSLTINYNGEQWRLGQLGRGPDRIDFQYSLDATSPNAGTYTAAAALDFASPTTNGIVGALDGNAAANRTALSSTISGLNIADAATFWIRWTDFNVTGADDGLAVDDFSLTPTTGTGGGGDGGNSVPEPATLALLAAGLAGLGFSRRRKLN